MSKLPKDSTLQLIAAEAEKQTLLLGAIAGKSYGDVLDYGNLANLIGSGAARSLFPVGNRLVNKWVDTRTSSSAEYDAEFDITHYSTVNKRVDGNVPAMFLQQHLTVPFGTEFSARQAFYTAPAGGLAAGTYNVTFSSTWGKMAAGTYQFTLSQGLEEGNQLVFASNIVDSVAPDGTLVNVFASSLHTKVLFTATLNIGSEGTSLGTLGTTQSNGYSPDGQVNQQHRTVYGDNFWPRSAVRQFLNSDAAPATVDDSGKLVGGWWSPQSKWDRPPSYATTTYGWLHGLDADFVDHMAEIEVKTSLPFCDGGTDQGAQYTSTWDRVFLPHAEQMYWTCNSYGIPYGIEGEAWDYYKHLYPQSSPAPVWTTHTEFIKFDLASPTTARSVCYGSPYRYGGCGVACCGATGGVDGGGAAAGLFVAPACAITPKELAPQE